MYPKRFSAEKNVAAPQDFVLYKSIKICYLSNSFQIN